MTTEPAGGWDERKMLLALYLHFAAEGWAPLTQVTIPVPGSVSTDGQWAGPTRRLDMLAVRRSPDPSIGVLERMAIEVKVSRRDFLADVTNPAKQAPARWLAHRHVYAVPHKLVGAVEVPSDSGLLYVREAVFYDRLVTVMDWARHPPLTPVPSHSELEWLTLLLAHRAADAEARVNGFTFNARQVGDNLADLHTALEITRNELYAAQRNLRRQEAKIHA